MRRIIEAHLVDDEESTERIELASIERAMTGGCGDHRTRATTQSSRWQRHQDNGQHKPAQLARESLKYGLTPEKLTGSWSEGPYFFGISGFGLDEALHHGMPTMQATSSYKAKR